MIYRQPPLQQQRAVTVVTAGQPLARFLGALLSRWRCVLAPAPAPGTLVLLEEGCPLPPGADALYLRRSPGGDENNLQLPLSLTALWSALERRFHSPPRRYLRKAVSLPVVAEYRQGRFDAHLSSLSEMGARILFPRELVRDEEVALGLTLTGRRWRLPGKVIYTLPKGDVSQEPATEVGVIFSPSQTEACKAIRAFVLQAYLKEVQQELGDETFRAALADIDLAELSGARL